MRSLLALLLLVSLPAPAAAQQNVGPLDVQVERARLSRVEEMATYAVDLCRQITAGCQDVWCLTNPAFETRIAAWPEARAVQVLCAQYQPTGDQSSVRELEPTLGDPYEMPPGQGWVTVGDPTPCRSHGERCRERSIAQGDPRLEKLHVIVPYGSERRFVEATVLVDRGTPPRRHPGWTDPRPPQRADHALMLAHLDDLHAVAVSQLASCGASLGEPGRSSAPLDLARTALARWPGWPSHLEAVVYCSHETSPSQTSGNRIAFHGVPTYPGGDTDPWGPQNARCIIPGHPCSEYRTMRGDAHTVMFHVEMRTPRSRGFVAVHATLHLP